MLDSVATHVELIQGDNILWVVIADVIIRSELTLDCLIGCQQLGNLNIKLLSALVANKVDLLVPSSADCNFIVPAQ